MVESEARLAEAQQIANVGSWALDIEENRQIRAKWSAELCRIYGIKESEVPQDFESFLSRIHEDDREPVSRSWAKAVETDGFYELEHRIVRPNGDVRIINTKSRLSKDQTGGIRHWFRASTDVTELKKAENALRESEARLIEAQEIAHIGSWERNFNDAGQTLKWSDEVYRIFGQDKADFKPTRDSLFACIHPEDRASVSQAFECDENHSYDYRIIRPDGEVRFVRAVSLISTAKDGKAFRRTGTVQDITEQEVAALRLNLLENEVQRRYRINAMGEMASSLAHELNQPLAAIGNYVEACRFIVKSGDQELPAAAADCLDNAILQARRAAGVIKSLRRFVGQDDGSHSPEQLNETIREITELASIGAVADGVRLELNLADNLPAVMIDRVQIQQVIANLMRNAMEAMAQSPQRVMSVTSRNNADEELVVEIGDTGAGMSAAALENLFTPFQSSKPGGMGIGLTISRRIIESHGGQLWAKRNPDGGMIFQFSLPLEEETSA